MLRLNVIGNLGRDCQYVSKNGFDFYSFSVAHTTKRRGANGDVVADTTWVDCVLTKEQGDKIAPYLLKGQKVYVSGNLVARAYQTKLGSYAVGLNMRVSVIELCGSATDVRKEQQPQGPQDFDVEQQTSASGNNDSANDAPF